MSMTRQSFVKHLSTSIQRLKIADFIPQRLNLQQKRNVLCEKNGSLEGKHNSLSARTHCNVASLRTNPSTSFEALGMTITNTDSNKFAKFPKSDTFFKHGMSKKKFESVSEHDSSHPDEQWVIEKRYILPSVNHTVQENIAILDPFRQQSKAYDLPTSVTSEKIDPTDYKQTGVGITGDEIKNVPKIEAKNVMKIRRKKMRHHKLMKWRKKYKFDIRRYKMKRLKLYEARLQQELADERNVGEKFDALKYIEEDLAKARQHGYKQDVFKSP